MSSAGPYFAPEWLDVSPQRNYVFMISHLELSKLMGCAVVVQSETPPGKFPPRKLSAFRFHSVRKSAIYNLPFNNCSPHSVSFKRWAEGCK
jgi:hypothetical protein